MAILPRRAGRMPRQMGRWLAVLALRREARLRIAAAPLELRCDPSRCPSGTGFFHDHFAAGHERRQRAEPVEPDAFKTRIAADIDKSTKVVDFRRGSSGPSRTDLSTVIACAFSGE
jgi:hypothetical protein